jgi:hypothetical protein
MTTCRRFFRECAEFSICVNIGKKDYVLAEHPSNTNTVFYYVVKGSGKLGKMFSEDFITIKETDFVDVRDTIYDYRVFNSLEDFHLVGFNTKDKSQGWNGRLVTENELDIKSMYDTPEITNKRNFLMCFDGKPVVNGKILKRYDYSEVYPTKTYNIEHTGILGLFTKL